MPPEASLLANRADDAQRGDFAARRGIREQARSYPIQRPGEQLHLTKYFLITLRSSVT
jgi:hypothetical protein